jgi:hypothetical protein
MDRLPLSARMIGRDGDRYIFEGYPHGREGPLMVLVRVSQAAYEQECGSAAKGIAPRVSGDDMMARIEAAAMRKLHAMDLAAGGHVDVDLADL